MKAKKYKNGGKNDDSKKKRKVIREKGIIADDLGARKVKSKTVIKRDGSTTFKGKIKGISGDYKGEKTKMGEGKIKLKDILAKRKARKAGKKYKKGGMLKGLASSLAKGKGKGKKTPKGYDVSVGGNVDYNKPHKKTSFAGGSMDINLAKKKLSKQLKDAGV